jgi:hypothetical protein
MLDRPDRGWGFKGAQAANRVFQIDGLRRRASELEASSKSGGRWCTPAQSPTRLSVWQFPGFILANKWTLPTAALGGIFLIGFILLIMNKSSLHP